MEETGSSVRGHDDQVHTFPHCFLDDLFGRGANFDFLPDLIIWQEIGKVLADETFQQPFPFFERFPNPGQLDLARDPFFFALRERCFFYREDVIDEDLSFLRAGELQSVTEAEFGEVREIYRRQNLFDRTHQSSP